MKFEPEIAYAVVPLAELIELIIDHRGKTPKKLGGDFTDSGVPVISAIHIKNGQIQWDERERYVSPEMFKKWMPIKLRKDDVLLTSEAPLGETALVPSDDDLVLSQRLFAIRCNKESLDPTYFKYFLTSPGGQIVLSDRASGSTVVGIRQAELLQIAVPHPDIKIQRTVGKLLLSLDAKIQSNNQLSKTLEEIAQTIFKSWFIDFDPVKAKMAGRKPVGMDAGTAALFPDAMEDSRLGLIPTGWNWKEIGKVLDVVGGGTPSTSNDEFWNGDIYWTTPKDLSSQQGLITTRSARMITPAGLSKISSGLIGTHSVLMSCRAPIGYISVNAVPTAVNQGFIAVKKSNGYSPLYLVNWLRANMTEIENRAGGATFAEITRKAFRELPFLVPDEAISGKFNSITSPILLELETLTLENHSLVSLRDSLLPRLISGELQIPEEMLAS